MGSSLPTTLFRPFTFTSRFLPQPAHAIPSAADCQELAKNKCFRGARWDARCWELQRTRLTHYRHRLTDWLWPILAARLQDDYRDEQVPTRLPFRNYKFQVANLFTNYNPQFQPNSRKLEKIWQSTLDCCRPCTLTRPWNSPEQPLSCRLAAPGQPLPCKHPKTIHKLQSSAKLSRLASGNSTLNPQDIPSTYSSGHWLSNRWGQFIEKASELD